VLGWLEILQKGTVMGTEMYTKIVLFVASIVGFGIGLSMFLDKSRRTNWISKYVLSTLWMLGSFALIYISYTLVLRSTSP